MTTTELKIAPPERLAGQGPDPNQEESGNRTIVALLTDGSHGETDWVATIRWCVQLRLVNRLTGSR
jgi:hypothetical protein